MSSHARHPAGNVQQPSCSSGHSCVRGRPCSNEREPMAVGCVFYMLQGNTQSFLSALTLLGSKDGSVVGTEADQLLTHG